MSNAKSIFVNNYLPPDDVKDRIYDKGHNKGWIQFGKSMYKLSVIHGNTKEVMGRIKG